MSCRPLCLYNLRPAFSTTNDRFKMLLLSVVCFACLLLIPCSSCFGVLYIFYFVDWLCLCVCVANTIVPFGFSCSVHDDVNLFFFLFSFFIVASAVYCIKNKLCDFCHS